MDIVKEHFENEANEYDQIIIRLIPYYTHMVDALLTAIPFTPNESFKGIDLGCGTGTISKTIADRFPKAQMTCLDVAENMLKLARHKLAHHANTRFILADLNHFSFEESYDVIVSSLALHHLVHDEDKIAFYQKIFAALSPGGIFFNADVVLASSDSMQQAYIQQWKAFMSKQVSLKEIKEVWLPNYYREDHPAPLLDQLSWLQEIGFVDVDVLWKVYNFAVYGGKKVER